MLMLMPYEVQEAQFPAKQRRPVYPPFETTDGHVMLSAVTQRNWGALFEAVGFADWRTDPMLATDRARQDHWGAMMARIEAWTRQRSCAECERLIGAAGVPVTPYLTVREALQSPQLAHRGSLAPVRDGAGEYRVPNLPFQLSDGLVQVRPAVPRLGEHTEQVLATLAGLQGDALRAVVERGRKTG